MKFETLVLEKYGAFEGRELVFRPGARLHLVLGLNESGKSTALNAIHDLLFGFESRTPFDFRFPAPQLRIGARLRLRDGSQIEFTRRKGLKKTIIDASGADLGDDLLAAVLAGVDRQLFRRDFGLDAQALRDGGKAILDAEGNLAETLAAGSSGLLALNRLKTRLQNEADDLFTSRRSASKPFYAAVDVQREADSALRAAIVTAGALKQAKEQSEAAAAAKTRVLDEGREIARALSRLQRASRTRSKLAELDQALASHARLAGLPMVDAADLNEWMAARQLNAEIFAKQLQANEALAANAQARAQLQLRPEWLAQAGEIENLRGELAKALDRRGDLPKREEAARAAHAALEDAAARLGLASVDALFEKMPTDIAMAGARHGLRARETLDSRIQDAADRLARAQREYEQHQTAAKTGEKDPALNPAPLLREFEVFASIPAVASRLREREADYAEALRLLEQDAARLQPSAGGLEQWLTLALPGETVIEDAIRQWSALREARQSLDRDMAENETRLQALEAQIAELAREGAIATQDDLLRARQTRDTAIDALETIADPAARPALLAHVRDAVRAADQIADHLLGDANRAARKLALDGDLAQARKAAAKLQTRESEHAAKASEARENWRQLWSPAGIAPLPPEAMRDWRKSVLSLIERHGKLAAHRAAISSARQQLADMAPALRAFAVRAGLSLPDDAPVEQYHAAAGQALARLRERWDANRTTAMALENAGARLEEARRECAALDEERARFAPLWQEAMAALSIHGGASADEAVAALDIWRSAITHRRDFTAADERASTLTRLIAEFEASLADACARLCGEHASEYAGETPERILEALTRQVEAARDASAHARHLEQDAAKIRSELQAMQTQSNGLEQKLASARSALSLAQTGAGDDQALSAALDQLAARTELEKIIGVLRADLAQIGDGLSPEDLRAEQHGIDFDFLEGEIERLKHDAARLQADAQAAAIAENEARKAFEALGAGRDAAGAASRRAQAGGELVDIANAWLARAAAARLAALAIERHRQSAQDPVLAAISRLFAAATGGAFAGIVVDFDERDQPEFRALRPDGARVPVTGLSEGARDQLFLALRLALLERRPGEPLPFIADDILASFDDERTGHSLSLLAGESGEKGETAAAGRQTILFTHHAHVAEIARARLGDSLDLIDLAR